MFIGNNRNKIQGGSLFMLDREKVGRAISAQRKIKGMTQKQLADLLNVSYQAVSRWEQGISLPSVDMIYDISHLLETTVDFLLNGSSEEEHEISYLDAGLDIKKLYLLKDKLSRLTTQNDMLLHAKYIDPIFFKLNTTELEDPVYVLANHVPGSKERLAMEYGYDREICMDLAANAINNLIRFGAKPVLLQATIVCGNHDSGQILIMGEAFKETCENNNIAFAGLELAAQPINYHPNEYKINASIIGIADRKKLITGNQITEGDRIIGLHTEGISSLSYPIIKVMIDRKPEIIYTKLDCHSTFIDELMKPNTSYAAVVWELYTQGLLHGIFCISNSLFRRRSYSSMPEGLGAAISAASIPLSPLFHYLYHLNMMNKECFFHHFSFGIGMLLVISETSFDKAIKIIEKHHKYYIMGKIKKNDSYPDEKVWIEGAVKW